jgi:hypothetical protein
MFEVIDYVVKINPSSLNIPEFKEIWKRDKSRSKNTAYAELSYVYYVCDYKSEYRNYPYEDRIDKVFEDHCRNQIGEDWKPDAKVKAAMEKYEQMQVTPSLRFLSSVEKQLDGISNFLNGTIADEETIKTIVDSIDKANKIILQLPKLKEAVKKEVSESTKIRGGGEIGMYED